MQYNRSALHIYIAVEKFSFSNNKCLLGCLTKLFSIYMCLLQSESSPLHLAAKNGHSEVVTLLITHGAKVDIKDKVSNFK